MGRRAALAVVVAVAAVVARGRDARAQPRPPDPAHEFDYGLSEMLAGRFATGCPSLEASYRHDPRLGTLFTLAECDAKWGKVGAALSHYADYMAQFARLDATERDKQGQRPGVARAQIDALSRDQPRLALSLPPGAPPGTTIKRDDEAVAPSELGTPQPVDPGDHVVRVDTPDGRTRTHKLTIAMREHRSFVVELPPPGDGPLPAPAATAPTAPAAPSTADAAITAPPPSEAPEQPAQPASARRPWIYVAGGIGVAGLALAGVATGVALSDKSSASQSCDASGHCSSQSAADSGNAARSWANVGTVALGVGLAGVAAAVVLWLTDPARSRPAAVTA